MAAARPFGSVEALAETADRVWRALSSGRLARGVRRAPRIGERPRPPGPGRPATGPGRSRPGRGRRPRPRRSRRSRPRTATTRSASATSSSSAPPAGARTRCSLCSSAARATTRRPSSRSPPRSSVRSRDSGWRSSSPRSMSAITTHVLDTSRGPAGRRRAGPARGSRGEDGVEVRLGGGRTDADGRAGILFGRRLLAAGTYRLTFDTGDLLRGVRTSRASFPVVQVVFEVRDPARALPRAALLLSPFGYSTYLGGWTRPKPDARREQLRQVGDPARPGRPRGTGRHDLRDLTVAVRFEGEFEAVHVGGRQLGGAADRHDEEHGLRAREGALRPRDRGLRPRARRTTSSARTRRCRGRRGAIEERVWDRHRAAPCVRRLARGARGRRGRPVPRAPPSMRSGLKDLLHSEDRAVRVLRVPPGPLHDPARRPRDRILATSLTAAGLYATAAGPFTRLWRAVRQTLLDTFAAHDSRRSSTPSMRWGRRCSRAHARHRRDPADDAEPAPPAVDLSPFGLAERERSLRRDRGAIRADRGDGDQKQLSRTEAGSA